MYNHSGKLNSSNSTSLRNSLPLSNQSSISSNSSVSGTTSSTTTSAYSSNQDCMGTFNLPSINFSMASSSHNYYQQQQQQPPPPVQQQYQYSSMNSLPPVYSTSTQQHQPALPTLNQFYYPAAQNYYQQPSQQTSPSQQQLQQQQIPQQQIQQLQLQKQPSQQPSQQHRHQQLQQQQYSTQTPSHNYSTSSFSGSNSNNSSYNGNYLKPQVAHKRQLSSATHRRTESQRRYIEQPKRLYESVNNQSQISPHEYISPDPDADISQFTEEDIVILKNLLPVAEIHKWKYISNILSKERSKKLNSDYCIKKFHDMFDLPFNPTDSLLNSNYFLQLNRDINHMNKNLEGVVGSSIPYITCKDGWNYVD